MLWAIFEMPTAPGACLLCFWSSLLFKFGPGAYLNLKICSRLLMVYDHMVPGRKVKAKISKNQTGNSPR